MNTLVARMMGKAVQEDVPVPVGSLPAASARGRDRRSVQRRTAAAAMLGLGEAEDEESIIPDDAEEIQNIAGPSGIKTDDEKVKKDKEAPEPDHPSEIPGASEEDRLLSPRDALVAPDVTPQAMEPIDASEVPAAKDQNFQQGDVPQVPKFVPPTPQASGQGQVNPMDVLLGRTSARSPKRDELPPENVVTAESAQSMVNTMLNVGGVSGEALLKRSQPMPDPTPSNPNRIMEAFEKYGPAKTWKF